MSVGSKDERLKYGVLRSRRVERAGTVESTPLHMKGDFEGREVELSG